MRRVIAAASATGLALTIGVATIALGADRDTTCWDEYNSSGTRFYGVVAPKGLPLKDCTPAPDCKVRYSADGKVQRLYVPHDGKPKTACTAATTTTTTTPPTTPTTPTVPSTGRFATLPVGATLPSDADCAARVRPMTENRPANATPNSVRGTSPNDDYPRVTGNFTGTTDEIIQWTACKWGIDEDLVRAQIVAESHWNQSALGDFTTNATGCAPGFPIGNYPAQYNGDRTHTGECPESVGLGQVRWLYHKSAFEDGNAVRSTAYNLDYTYAVWRKCFEGGFRWLNDVDGRGDYAAGDAAGCQGVWFSGRWYTTAAVGYIDRVQGILANRAWAQQSFPPAFPVLSGGSPGTPTTVAPVPTTQPPTTQPPTTTAPTTSTTTSTTTTTAPPATTAPPTTKPPTTTAPPTTAPPTTAPPTTPPRSSGFVETFDTAASLDRFDYAVHHAWTANPTDETWIGDHDLNCGAPEPGRTITNPTRVNDGKTYYPGMRDPVVYWCRQHIMTTFNTNHYAQVDFAPKQTFENVNRVCWDQNRTNFGGRTWTQMVVVPMDTFNANKGRFDYVASRFSPSGPGKYGIHPTDETLLVEISRGAPRVQVGQAVYDGGNGWNAGSDKASRFQICVENVGSNQVRVTQQRADGGADVYTRSGRIPAGKVKVIFQHDLYNPDKDPGVANGYTFHWDNLIIE